ncbi:MAG: hypothetical protein K1X68_13225, partial [Saprospiraceae bacterium]|nr:hypothetical protein [Saprospiraceae bacterium]
IKISNLNYGFVGLGEWLGSETKGIIGIVDSNFNLLSKNTKSGYGNCWYKRIVLDSSGGIIVAARTNTIGTGFDGLLIEKYDFNLKLTWQNYINLDFRELDTYAIENFEHPLALVLKSNGTIIIFEAANWTESDHSSIAQLTISNKGDLISKKLYNTRYFSETPYDVAELNNGSYAVAGAVNDYASNNLYSGKSFIMLVDSSGRNTVHYFGKEDSISKLLSVKPINSGVISLGFSDTDSLSNGLDNLIVITDSLGNIYPNRLKIGVREDINKNCKLDPEDSLSKQYLIFVTGPMVEIKFSSNREASQFDLPNGKFTVNIRRIDFNSQWTPCDSTLTVDLSPANRAEELNFLVSPSNELCNNIQIGISQPDLIKCTASDFIISIENKNIRASNPFYLDIKTEDGLEFVSSSTKYERIKDKQSFFIDSIRGGKFNNIMVTCNTSCNVQLGASHLFQMEIIDTNSCIQTNVAEYRIDAYCDGSYVVFQIYNHLNESTDHKVYYKVYYNQFLFYSSISDNVTMSVKPNGRITEIKYPANGGTWRLELLPDSALSDKILASASLEACGTTNLNAHHIGFRNNINSYDGPNRKRLILTNSTSKSNAISNSFEGSGYYHLVDKLEEHECNIRFKNSLIRDCKVITIDLIFSKNYDLSTFRPVQFCCDYKVALSEANTITIQFIRSTQTAIPDSSDEFNFKYFITPFSTTWPDDRQDSYFTIIGSYYLDDSGPFDLRGTYYNYSVKVDQSMDSSKLYKENFYELFSNGYNRARSFYIINENVYTICQSTDFNESGQVDLLLYTSTLDLKLKNIKPIQQSDVSGTYYDSKFTMSKELVCIFLNNKDIIVTKYTLDGDIVWSKSFMPGLNQEKVINAKLDIDEIGNIYVAGNLTGSKQAIFITSIDSSGNLIFTKNFKNKEYVSRIIYTNSNALIIVSQNYNSFPIFNQPYTYIYNLNSGDWSGFLLNALGNSNDINDLIPVENNYYIQINEIESPLKPNGSRVTPSIAKYDGYGHLIYSRIVKIDSLMYSSFSSGVYNPADNHYYFVGYNKKPNLTEKNDVLVCCTDQEGSVLWWKSYGNINDESGLNIRISGDKLILIAESIEGEPAYRYQPIIIFCDINGNPVNIVDRKDKKELMSVDLMPNPSKNVLHIIVDEKINLESIWWIVNDAGQVIKSGKLTRSIMDIDINDLANGTYYFIFPLYNRTSIFIKT